MNHRPFVVYPGKNPDGFPIMVGILAAEFDSPAARSPEALKEVYDVLITRERDQGYVVSGADFWIGRSLVGRWR